MFVFFFIFCPFPQFVCFFVWLFNRLGRLVVTVLTAPCVAVAFFSLFCFCVAQEEVQASLVAFESKFEAKSARKFQALQTDGLDPIARRCVVWWWWW